MNVPVVGRRKNYADDAQWATENLQLSARPKKSTICCIIYLKLRNVKADQNFLLLCHNENMHSEKRFSNGWFCAKMHMYM